MRKSKQVISLTMLILPSKFHAWLKLLFFGSLKIRSAKLKARFQSDWGEDKRIASKGFNEFWVRHVFLLFPLLFTSGFGQIL
jgi:hypothetical protein